MVKSGFQAATLDELRSADRGQVFEERRSSGYVDSVGGRLLVDYRSAHRALLPGPRPVTVAEHRERLARLEQTLQLEPGALLG